MPSMTDQAARDAVRTGLGETMFLEAGAGSGKTSCLVDRFVALVEDGVEADRIAAITFTEKAAAELADRIRTELEKRAPASERCTAALAVVDRAAICTLHAFAQRILTAHPIEAGLPPRVTVLDEIASQLAFEERWESFVDRIIERDDLERPLRLLLASNATIDHLHEAATKLGQSWDLVAERVGAVVPGEVPALVLDDLDADLAVLATLADGCTVDDDGLLVRCEAIAAWGERLHAAPDDDARLELLRALDRLSRAGTVGRKGSWPDKDAVTAAVDAVKARAHRLAEQVQQACLVRLTDELAAFTVEAARERAALGELEFHDLLVLARHVLRDPVHGVEVRAALAHRYQRLLLDEFQDTDPIQVELAVLIGSSDPDAATKRWEDVAVEAGRLFFVGDPKQSIYRFRRADIGVFLRARDAVGGHLAQLTTNFRTVEPILH
ncbi:MAG TPA: UvrD-helicase domain-containing protein, partial [Acidimicrobiales bacterium]|nr:UvrD-helicase domain-containing protein [Acidimicrobiales bacterium]